MGQPDHQAGGLEMAINPIDAELLRNHMASIADEMYVALMKSAYSTNIK